MICRSCSAEIDAKAIVCYRCGAPTADALAEGPRPGRTRVRWGWVLVILLALAAALVAFRLFWHR